MKTLFLSLILSVAFVQISHADPKAEAKTKFETICAACHGTQGQGDGPAAAALNPKPRNFTESAYMKTRTDEQLAKVIKEGGAAAGKSPMMAAYGSMLSDDQIKEIVAYIRTLAK